MEPTIIPILNAQQQGMSSWAHGVNVLPEMAQANAQNLAFLSGFRQREGKRRNMAGTASWRTENAAERPHGKRRGYPSQRKSSGG